VVGHDDFGSGGALGDRFLDKAQAAMVLGVKVVGVEPVVFVTDTVEVGDASLGVIFVRGVDARPKGADNDIYAVDVKDFIVICMDIRSDFEVEAVMNGRDIIPLIELMVAEGHDYLPEVL